MSRVKTKVARRWRMAGEQVIVSRITLNIDGSRWLVIPNCDSQSYDRRTTSPANTILGYFVYMALLFTFYEDSLSFLIRQIRSGKFSKFSKFSSRAIVLPFKGRQLPVGIGWYIRSNYIRSNFLAKSYLQWEKYQITSSITQIGWIGFERSKPVETNLGKDLFSVESENARFLIKTFFY